MMKLRAVLTGDLVHSRKSADPVAYVSTLKRILTRQFLAPLLDVNFFRGDGFQVVPLMPCQALECAVLIRAGIIANSPKGERWDSRISIALGQDAGGELGEVFILSGQTLDEMTKRSPLLVFRGTNAGLTNRYELLTEFVSAIIDKWTVVEAKTYWTHRRHMEQGQEAIAQQLGKTRTTVSKALQRAQANLVDKYIDYTQKSLQELETDG